MSSGLSLINDFMPRFDPIHEGHITVVSAGVEALSCDEVVFIPNASPPNKPSISSFDKRIELLKARLTEEATYNIYLESNLEATHRIFGWHEGKSVGASGLDAMLARVGAIYETPNVVCIFGVDAFLDCVENGQLNRTKNTEIGVYSRTDVPSSIPPEFEHRVVLLSADTLHPGSSSLAREYLSRGETPPSWLLHPSVSERAKALKLYTSR